jgi:DNA replication protein DnaC
MNTAITPIPRAFIKGVEPLGSCNADTFNCSISQFAEVLRSPEANEIVTVKCSRPDCNTMCECTRFIANFVGCDECREQFLHEEGMKKARTYWEKICPVKFRESDINRTDFPKAIWLKAKKDFLEGGCKKSQFLIGPTGSAKTRIAFLMLKHALLKGFNIGVLWPEDLPRLNTAFKSENFERFATIGVLLVDDGLLSACRDSKQTDYLKMLIDVRMRNSLTTIFTSQVGANAFMAGNKEYGDLQDADIQRIDAIMRRLREDCDIVTFKSPKLGQGEVNF